MKNRLPHQEMQSYPQIKCCYTQPTYPCCLCSGQVRCTEQSSLFRLQAKILLNFPFFRLLVLWQFCSLRDFLRQHCRMMNIEFPPLAVSPLQHQQATITQPLHTMLLKLPIAFSLFFRSYSNLLFLILLISLIKISPVVSFWTQNCPPFIHKLFGNYSLFLSTTLLHFVCYCYYISHYWKL